MARKVIWEEGALEYMEKALDWISRDSIDQAENVQAAILDHES